MDLKEVDQMSLFEERGHWWIKTRFLYLDRALSFLKNRKNVVVYEFGCGTGQNLWYLRTVSKFSKLIKSCLGLDPELPEGFRAEGLKECDQLSRNLSDAKVGFADLVIGMDVLEHINDDKLALEAWVLSLKDDGYIFITVPAFQTLWSYHDELLDHKRRYTKESLLDIADSAGLEPVYLRYAFSYLYPVIYLVRKLKASSGNTSTDLKLPPSFINAILYFLGEIEARLGGSSFCGTSVIGIFKKKGA